jgi:hypothetical protein
MALGNLAHGILAPKRIANVLRALRIIPPLAIDQEAVLMRAGTKFDGGPPNSILAFAHVDGLLLPARKIARQLHSCRRRRLE